MTLKILISIVFILLLLLIVSVALLWTFIRWNNKKSRDTGCLVAILFLILTLICGGYMVYKGVNKAKEKISDSINTVSTSMSSYRNYPFLDTLKSMQPVNIQIPNEYFTYAGFRDSYRMPFIYPYSINAIDILDNGFICDESDKEVNRNEQILHNITNFTFDKNIFVSENKGHLSSDSTYFTLLHLDTGVKEIFNSKTKMNIKADSLGFDTLRHMLSIEDYHNKFFRKN